MESMYASRTYFHGSHHIDGHPTCGRDCGHAWTVTVYADLEELDRRTFGKAVSDIAAELQGKDIDAMVAPGTSTPDGLARWFYERLAINHAIREVSVWQSKEVGAVLRAP